MQQGQRAQGDLGQHGQELQFVPEMDLIKNVSLNSQVEPAEVGFQEKKILAKWLCSFLYKIMRASQSHMPDMLKEWKGSILML